MTLTLPLSPSANRYWRHARGRTYLSADARQYRLAVRAVADSIGVVPLAGPLCVCCQVYFPDKRGDLDNRIKQLWDSLNGIAWLDDRQVEEMHLYRRIDKADPRIIISVRVTEEGAP